MIYLYANFRHSRGQFFRLRRINPKVEFAFLLILFICVFHVRSSDIVNPKYGLRILVEVCIVKLVEMRHRVPNTHDVTLFRIKTHSPF